MRSLFVTALARLLLTFVILHSSFGIAPAASGDWQIGVKNDAGQLVAKNITLSNGQVLGKTGGLPAAITPFSGTFAALTGTPTTLAGYGIADAITAALAASTYAPIAHNQAWSTITSTPTTLAGYGIADAITAALAAATYEPILTAGTTAQYYRGDKSWQTLNATAVGLGNVSNALQLVAANNLSDLVDAATARSNLGLGLLNSPQFATGVFTDGDHWVELAFGSSPALVGPVQLALDMNGSARLISLSGNLTVSSTATISNTNTGDQTISLTGDVTGSGTGSFAATIGAGKVTNDMLAGSIALSKLSITGTPDGTKVLRDDGVWTAIASGITIGSTTITGGTSTQMLYNLAGVVQESALIKVGSAGLSVENHVYSPAGTSLYLGSNGYTFGGQCRLSPSGYNNLTGLGIRAADEFGWSEDSASYGLCDVKLSRDAAAVLALKNATTAQTMRIYGTTTGNKYLSLAHDGTNAVISASSGTVSITTGGLTIGASGSAISASLTTTTTWDPGNLADGASETKTGITLTGVVVGDVVDAALTTLVSASWDIEAVVTSANTVAVSITNRTGGDVDLSSSTLRVNCLKY